MAAVFPVELAFDLVGGWTSPMLFVRMLGLGEPRWEVRETGFTDRVTGASVSLAMSGPSRTLAASFAAGIDLFQPTIDADLLEEILGHRAVVSVTKRLSTPSRAAAADVMGAVDAVINAGALAVRCRTSGVAHGADGFHAIALALAAAGAAAGAAGGDAGDDALLSAYVRFRPGPPADTLGMGALGAPDLRIDGTVPVNPERDLPRLRAAAHSRLTNAGTAETLPDDRGLGPTLANPYGIATI